MSFLNLPTHSEGPRIKLHPTDDSAYAMETHQTGDPDGNSLVVCEGWCPENLTPTKLRVNSSGELVVNVDGSEGGQSGFGIPVHDTRECGYDSQSRLETITYKSNGVTIATLTLSYDGSNRLVSVVKS